MDRVGGTGAPGGSAQAEYNGRRTREQEVQRSYRSRAVLVVGLAGPAVYLLVVVGYHLINAWFSPQLIAHAFLPKGAKPSGQTSNLLPIVFEQPIAVLAGAVAALGLVRHPDPRRPRHGCDHLRERPRRHQPLDGSWPVAPALGHFA
jgi:hypothetical protein